MNQFFVSPNTITWRPAAFPPFPKFNPPPVLALIPEDEISLPSAKDRTTSFRKAAATVRAKRLKIDGVGYDRILLELAEAFESGTVPGVLADIATPDQVRLLFSHPNGPKLTVFAMDITVVAGAGADLQMGGHLRGLAGDATSRDLNLWESLLLEGFVQSVESCANQIEPWRAEALTRLRERARELREILKLPYRTDAQWAAAHTALAQLCLAAPVE